MRLRRALSPPSQQQRAAKAALLLLGNASAQTPKERWKKVTKDLNKDLMSLAEDPEMFEELGCSPPLWSFI